VREEKMDSTYGSKGPDEALRIDNVAVALAVYAAITLPFIFLLFLIGFAE
jgi:hypothetical protein